MTSITARIERELGIPGLASQLAERLEPADLQSLLLQVYRLVAARRQQNSLLADYLQNRFVRPSPISPARYLDWERVTLSSLPNDVEAVELSPVCPLGASAVMAGLGQDRALSTIRNTEVVSDSTNVLALEAAARRRTFKHADARSATPVHLAASHRLLRTQRYHDPRLASHFRAFSLCSACRDRGAFDFEVESLAMHIGFYVRAIRAFVGPIPLRVLLTPLETASTTVAADRLLEQLRRTLPDVDVALYPERDVGRQYYRDVCFWIYATSGVGESVQLTDGGCVDWAGRLLSDAKERLVISGAGSDRIVTLRSAT